MDVRSLFGMYSCAGDETLAPLLPLLFPSPQEVHHFL